MTKNIVICCDGTRNEFGAQNSSLVKLYQTLVCDPSQLTYYHPGVAAVSSRSSSFSAFARTMGARIWMVSRPSSRTGRLVPARKPATFKNYSF